MVKTFTKLVEKDFYTISVENPTTKSTMEISVSHVGQNEEEAAFTEKMMHEMMASMSLAIRKYRKAMQNA